MRSWFIDVTKQWWALFKIDAASPKWALLDKRGGVFKVALVSGYICTLVGRLKSLRNSLVLHFVFFPFLLHGCRQWEPRHSSLVHQQKHNRVRLRIYFLCSADLGLFCWYCYILFSTVENKNTHKSDKYVFPPPFLCCRKGAVEQTIGTALLISTGSTHRRTGCWRMNRHDKVWGLFTHGA